MLSGDRLMRILFKGYKIPKAAGRYIDLGMSFKKNQEKKQSTSKLTKAKQEKKKCEGLS